MPQSFTKLWLHIVFSTKNRHPHFEKEGIRGEMHAYLAETCRKLGCPAQKVGGVADHVHILCCLSKTLAIADLVKEIKRPSSSWIKKRDQCSQTSPGKMDTAGLESASPICCRLNDTSSAERITTMK